MASCSILSIQCADVRASAAFYDAVLGALGGARAMDFGEVIGFGAVGKPEFWIAAELVTLVPAAGDQRLRNRAATA
jgi:catechol 2,3-dioxygenase-like lactoylglutathione lyase family enzyme